MTDNQKVEKMFEIRKKERPDLNDAAARVQQYLSIQFTAYQALLKMYNKRYGDKENEVI